MKLELMVNERLYLRDVPADMRLVDLLRGELGLLAAKPGCYQGECGACTVIMDGKLTPSCLVLAVQAEGSKITTTEGIPDPYRSALHAAFADNDAVQCGYCTPGMLIASYALLLQNSDPDEKTIRLGLSGNLCRCTGYVRIVDAVKKAARLLDPKTSRI